MAVGDVFFGRKLSARVASYGEPTPWQATLAEPRIALRAVQTWGPTTEPYFWLASVCLRVSLGLERGGEGRIGNRGTNHVPNLGGAACKDEGHVLAGAVLELIRAGRLASHDCWESIIVDCFIGSWVRSCYCNSGESRDDEGLELHTCEKVWRVGLSELGGCGKLLGRAAGFSGCVCVCLSMG